MRDHVAPPPGKTVPSWVSPGTSHNSRGARASGGADFNSMGAEDSMSRISPWPTVIIHGEADDDMQPSASRVNHAHARAPRRLWIVSGFGQDATVSPGGAATTPRLSAVLARAPHGAQLSAGASFIANAGFVKSSSGWPPALRH
jgi:hypothetical protein